MTDILKRSLKDFLSKRYLILSIFPFIASFAVLGIVFLYLGSEFFDMLSAAASTGEFPSLDKEAHPILSYILTMSLVQWIIVTFFYVFGSLFTILLSVMIAVVVIGFFTPYIVKNIQKSYYTETKRKSLSLGFAILSYMKTVVIFIVLLVVCLPALLIPGINLLVMNLPFYYLFKKFLVLDVGSSINNKEEFLQINKTYGKSILFSTLIFFSLSLIPVAGIFLQIFFVIFLTHLFFEKTMQIREK